MKVAGDIKRDEEKKTRAPKEGCLKIGKIVQFESAEHFRRVDHELALVARAIAGDCVSFMAIDEAAGSHVA